MSKHRSPNSLEDELEATRQRLAATIDQLVERSHPKSIAKRQAEDAVGYFVAADGTPRTENIAKVAAGVVGVVVTFVVIRKLFR